MTRFRPTIRGKFLFLGDRKLYVRGVTYGTFRPDANGDEFPPPPVSLDGLRRALDVLDTTLEQARAA